MAEKPDRRTRKTREQLRSALLALLKEKRYEDISVQDIIERADVARSTFYVHYMDKDDLLTGSQGVFAANLGHSQAAHAAESRPSAFSARLWFQHVQKQAHILKLIAKGPALDLAMKTLRGILQRNIEAEMQAHAQMENTPVPMPLIVEYLTNTLMTLMQWWLKDGMKRTPEQMDEMFQQLVLPGLGAALKGAKHETH